MKTSSYAETTWIVLSQVAQGNQGARKALHSYTHVGMLQLGRRFSGTDLKSSYSEGELSEVIRVSTSAVFMVNNIVTKHFGFEAEWKENNRLLAEWAKHD